MIYKLLAEMTYFCISGRPSAGTLLGRPSSVLVRIFWGVLQDASESAPPRADLRCLVSYPSLMYLCLRGPHIQMSKENLDQFSELAGKELEVPALCMYIMKYMIDKGMKLDNTEGMIDASVFPVNYFTLKQVYFQYHGLLSFQLVINFCIPWFISRHRLGALAVCSFCFRGKELQYRLPFANHMFSDRDFSSAYSYHRISRCRPLLFRLLDRTVRRSPVMHV